MKQLPKHQRVEAVALYLRGHSVRQIAHQFGESNWVISATLKTAGLRLRNRSQAGKLAVQRDGRWQDRYIYHHSVFHFISEPEQAYWLGFLAADGYVSDNGIIQLALGISDLKQLEKFKRFLQTDAPIKYGHISDKLGERDYCRLTCCSSEIWSDLIRHGITPRKTKSVAWPAWLSQTLCWPYLLGYFDGDGGFCLGAHGSSSIQWSIAGHAVFLLSAQTFLMSELGLRQTKLIRRSQTDVIKSLSYSGTVQVLAISLSMYRSCPIRMERKTEKLISYLTANSRLAKSHRTALEELSSFV